MIKEILDKIGITDITSNREYCSKLKERGVTDEDVELLNPENIDLIEFWELARELDNCSIVGGGLVKDNKSTLDIVSNNIKLYKDCGIVDFLSLDNRIRNNLSVLEYGCGYAPITWYLNCQDYYLGIDLIRNTQPWHFLQTDGKSIPQVVKINDGYDICLCINVFQHMIDSHVVNVLKLFKDNISKKGMLITTFMIKDINSNLNNMLKHRDMDEYYTYTCGQLIPLRTQQQCFNILQTAGFGTYKYINRCDGFMTIYSRNV